MVKPPNNEGATLSACKVPDEACSPLAAQIASSLNGNGQSSNRLAANAPPAAEAPEDPIPLQGRTPFLIVSSRPKSAWTFLSTSIAATDAVQLKPSYGTGTAPTNGQATAGTQVGTGVNITLPTGPGTLPFWTECIITGLVLGTPVWFDLEAIFAAGTLVVSNVVAIAMEM